MVDAGGKLGLSWGCGTQSRSGPPFDPLLCENTAWQFDSVIFDIIINTYFGLCSWLLARAPETLINFLNAKSGRSIFFYIWFVSPSS